MWPSGEVDGLQWGNYAVATRLDYSLAVKNGALPSLTTAPAKPGDMIVLWGTGSGPTSPVAPTGAVVPSDTTYNTTSAVTVTVGGVPATVYGAALTPGDAGLYQVAIQIPSSLVDGDYAIVRLIASVEAESYLQSPPPWIDTRREYPTAVFLR
jgi:uncharacterized protein (TIGR03437 family)